MFKILLSNTAELELKQLERNHARNKQLKAVRKCIALLSYNPRHPGLNTHKFTSLSGPEGEDIFEAYAENRTSSAYRVFWYYGPNKGYITILAITPHP